MNFESTEEMLNYLKESPILKIQGIVNSSGLTSYRIGGEELRSISLAFDSWRVEGEEVRRSKLTIFKRLKEEEFKEMRNMSGITRLCIARIKANLSFIEGIGDCAFLQEVVQEKKEDFELEKILEELKKPVYYVDEFFGNILYEKDSEDYYAKVKWYSDNIEVFIIVKEKDEIVKKMEILKHIYKNWELFFEKSIRVASEKLLCIKNKFWLEENESRINEKEFSGCFTLEAISIYRDDSFDFSFDCKDLFGGHIVSVEGNLDKGILDVDIQG